MALNENKIISGKRLVALDVMRGAIMILLAAESARVYDALAEFKLTGLGGVLTGQFFHHPWNGLHFWDLVQPAFMFIAGSAMYISFYYKNAKGITWQQNFRHIAIRCFKLFICGVALHCIYAGRLVWELWNVLTQLAFTTLIAYLIIRRSYRFQILFSLGLLLCAELLYRYTHIPGFDQPFVQDHNFGSWADLQIMGKLNPGGGWVFVNIITTAAHTIWGVLAGKLLISSLPDNKKIKYLLLSGLAALLLGYGLDLGGITPVIKRIATSAFTLASGGWVLLILAAVFWLVDIKKKNRYAWIASIVGMNSIFIYLLFETVGSQWLNRTTGIFTGGFAALLGAGIHWQALFTSLASLTLLWLLCYWLYKRKIFFKL